jgi:hypothetical protein
VTLAELLSYVTKMRVQTMVSLNALSLNALLVVVRMVAVPIMAATTRRIPVPNQRLLSLITLLPFHLLKQRIHLLNQRVPPLNQRIHLLNQRVPQLKQRVPPLNQRVSSLKQRVPPLSQRIRQRLILQLQLLLMTNKISVMTKAKRIWIQREAVFESPDASFE